MSIPCFTICCLATHSMSQVTSNKLPLPEDETDSGKDGGLLDTPKMTVNVASKDVMQMMISKTSLDVFKSLGQVSSPH